MKTRQKQSVNNLIIYPNFILKKVLFTQIEALLLVGQIK